MEAEHELKRLGFEVTAHRVHGLGTLDGEGLRLGAKFAENVLAGV